MSALGLAAITTLSARVAALDNQRAEWGERVSVAVVTKPVAVGEPVIEAIEIKQLPQALIPPGFAGHVALGRLAKVPLYPGEVVHTARLSVPGSSGEDAPLTAALTLPVTVQVPLLVEGALVDLWIVDGADLSSRRIAEHVAVLAFSDRDITVAVPNDQIDRATATS